MKIEFIYMFNLAQFWYIV